MVNRDLRLLIFDKELTFKQVAQGCGISREYLSRLMQKPVSEKNRRKILDGIMAAEQAKG